MNDLAEWLKRMSALPPLQYDKDAIANGEANWPTALRDLEDLIGCYSEAFFACGYNDDDVFSLLLSGQMDEVAKDPSMGKHWFECQMGENLRSDGRYADALMAAVERASGVWPHAARLNGGWGYWDYWQWLKVDELANKLGLVPGGPRKPMELFVVTLGQEAQ